MKNISALAQAAGALAAVLLLASCDGQQAEAPPAPAPAAVDMSATLSPVENANMEVALRDLPEGAHVSHVIPDGPLVVLHYVDTSGPVAGITFLLFDDAHTITQRNGVELASNPRVHLATPPAPASDPAVEQANRQVVRDYLTAVSAGNLDAAAAQLAPNFADHSGPEPSTRDQWLATARAAPRTEFGLQHIAAWNNLVATYASVGTHQNGSVLWRPGYDVFRLENGKIAERWHINY